MGWAQDKGKHSAGARQLRPCLFPVDNTVWVCRVPISMLESHDIRVQGRMCMCFLQVCLAQKKCFTHSLRATPTTPIRTPHSLARRRVEAITTSRVSPVWH